MKKNLFFSMIAILVALAMCVGFVSCGDDNKEDIQGTNSLLIGIWRNTGKTGYVERTFRKDGSGTVVTVTYGEDTFTSKFTYIYDTKAGNLSWKEEGDDMYLVYKVESLTETQLVLSGITIPTRMTFTKVKD